MKAAQTPMLLLAIMGSLDCITTVIGTVRYGTVELNPIMSGLISTNIVAFVFLKLATTFLVCIIFIQAERLLMKTVNKNTTVFTWTKRFLKLSMVGVTVFLCLIVANNIMVLANAR